MTKKDTDKLDKIKTDLEIKLVKLELEKIKLQESQLQKDAKTKKIKPALIDTKATNKSFNKPKEKSEEKNTPIIVKNTEDKTKKRKYSKLIFFILTIILIIFIATFTLKYINTLKSEIQNKEKLLIDKEKEDINFSTNEFFKDVEEEVDEDELQDFSNYKDIPEIVVNNTTDNKNVVVSKKINNQIKNANKPNTKIVPNITNAKDIPKVSTSKPNIEISTPTKKIDSVQKNQKITIEEAKITSDFIKVIALQYKDKKYKIPKKAKKTNSFSIRVRLNKFKKTTTNNNVKIMLVIKNTVGKTLKIDVKEVDFTKIKTTYITFYESFSSNLELNEEYSFSILANDKLIKNTTKRI